MSDRTSQTDVTEEEAAFVLACMADMARASRRLERDLTALTGDSRRALAILSLSHLAFAGGSYARADSATPERFEAAASVMAEWAFAEAVEDRVPTVVSIPERDVVTYYEAAAPIRSTAT